MFTKIKVPPELSPVAKPVGETVACQFVLNHIA
jgi:hypothetical protein